MNQCTICNWSQDDMRQPLVFETLFWRVLVSPNQSLLGRCFVNRKRHETRLSLLDTSEIEDWLAVVKQLEASVTAAFGATMFNWQCNLNFAYREPAPDSHIHWHFMPRYDKEVMLFGHHFGDPDFGGLYKTRSFEPPLEILNQIAVQMRNHA